ncbi:MAG: phosphonate C-P lyase system protein PhnG [Syntrophobacteraceae bacterium]|jgi:alpha-D-ribose 1-methylphosphonate 5-triphosphate synthase subunit PhnG
MINDATMDMQSLIMKMDGKSVEKLRRILQQEDIGILKGPDTGLVMMAVKDAFGVDFYLGEILVTETTVVSRGVEGYAMVMGHEPDRSLIAASVDVVMRGGSELIKKRIRRIVSSQVKQIADIENRERSLFMQTKVNFETMVKG